MICLAGSLLGSCRRKRGCVIRSPSASRWPPGISITKSRRPHGWSVRRSDVLRAVGGAPLVQFIDAGDADVGSGGGVDAGGRRTGPAPAPLLRAAAAPGPWRVRCSPRTSNPRTSRAGTRLRARGRQPPGWALAAQELAHSHMLRPCRPARWGARIAAVRCGNRPFGVAAGAEPDRGFCARSLRVEAAGIPMPGCWGSPARSTHLTAPAGRPRLRDYRPHHLIRPR